MTLDTSHVGRSGAMVERSWTASDALLYAVAVGAGSADPTKELEFTTENSAGIDQQVLPSFICVAAGAPLPEGLDIDFTKMLHAEMGFLLYKDVPVDGKVTSTTTVRSIYDKGSGALVSTVTEVLDAATKEPVAQLDSALFIRGAGGFGGDRGPRDPWQLPDREPDETITASTLKEQALIYRLTGDRNPLHSDPEFANKAGFPRPILHGMCTYGFTARILLHAAADSNPSKFGSMSARFSKTVEPGETLTVQVWHDEAGALFRTLNENGEVVLDMGRLTHRS
ncbi:MaoC family dehydratase [Pseudarthrobacter sp. B4EP4b]|uniref:MaoC family dehydratase n=1 Tax=Pseudarthrobacter sp. B4EP4b TaxID=2590664 RepID=UPI001154C97B|nr:MaoC family dehydratase [Pseudarthrobacter sp. B4EP4b]